GVVETAMGCGTDATRGPPGTGEARTGIARPRLEWPTSSRSFLVGPGLLDATVERAQEPGQVLALDHVLEHRAHVRGAGRQRVGAVVADARGTGHLRGFLLGQLVPIRPGADRLH